MDSVDKEIGDLSSQDQMVFMEKMASIGYRTPDIWEKRYMAFVESQEQKRPIRNW